MGYALDMWLEEEDNLAMWCGEGAQFPMWRKRVLITQLLAQAWEHVCGRFDFEKAATRIGMRMTMIENDEADKLIQIQGVENYSFCDADAGT